MGLLMGGKPLVLEADPKVPFNPFGAAPSRPSKQQTRVIEEDSATFDEMLDTFFKSDKLFLILTNAGKPIYSS